MKQKIGTQKNENILTYLYVGLFIVLIPLVYVTKALDAAMLPRFFAWGCGLLVFSFLLFSKEKNILGQLTPSKILKNRFVVLLTIIVIFSGLSLFNAINPSEGIFDLFKSIFTLYFLIISILFFRRFPKAFLKTATVITLVSIFHSLSGILEYIAFVVPNPDKILETGRSVLYKVTGVMAHKNQLVIALYLTIPFSVYTVLFQKGVWQKIAWLSLLLVLINVFMLKTRSVFLAILIGGIISSTIFILHKNGVLKDSNKIIRYLKFGIIGFFGIFIILIAAIKLTGNGKKATKVVQNTSMAVLKLAKKSDFWRLKVWHGTTKMALKNPVLGVGSGNWKIQIPQYYKVKNLNRKPTWRRPHNDFFWLFAEIGIVGCLAYISLFVGAFLMLLRLIFVADNQKNRLFYTVLLGVIVGYSIISFVSFPYERINHQVYISLIFAVITTFFYKEVKTDGDKSVSIKHYSYIGYGIILMGIIFGGTALASEINRKKAKQAVKKQAWTNVHKFIDKAFSPFTTLDFAGTPLPAIKGLAFYHQKKFDAATAEFLKALKYNPHHADVITDLASVYLAQKKYTEAIELLEKALIYVPKFEKALINLSIIYYQEGDKQKSYEALLRCRENTRNQTVLRNKRALEKELKMK